MEREDLINNIVHMGMEVPEEYKKDYDFALAIAKENGYFIKQFDSSIIDKNIALEALRSNYHASEYIPDNFFDDKDVAMLIVSNDGHLLWKMSDRLIDDEEVVLEAIKNDPDAIKFASDRLKNDSSFMEKCKNIKKEVEQVKKEKEETENQEKLAKVEEYKDKEIWWNDPGVVNYYTIDEAVTDDMITRIENKYNKKLPNKYVELLKQQNGGRLIKRCFVNDDGQVYIVDSILGIPSNESDSTSLESDTDNIREVIMEYELNSIDSDNVIIFGNDESGGHANYIFDYTELNENGEPRISYFDNELDENIVISDSFEDFVSHLKIREETELK